MALLYVQHPEYPIHLNPKIIPMYLSFELKIPRGKKRNTTFASGSKKPSK